LKVVVLPAPAVPTVGYWKAALEANVDVWMKPVVPLTLNGLPPVVPVRVAPIWPIVLKAPPWEYSGTMP
jgi:hypothetical protein